MIEADRIDRLIFLDFLRGVAALYVSLFHLFVTIFNDSQLPGWLIKFNIFGHSGVTLFFLISGFSLSLTMKRHLGSPSPLTSFFISRSFRLLPFFYFMLALSVLKTIVFDKEFHGYIAILINMSMLYNLFFDAWTGIVLASWTLSIEFIFYIFFPLFYFYLMDINRLIFSIVFALFIGVTYAAIFQILNEDYDYRSDFIRGNFFTHLPTFFVGMLVYRVYSEKLYLVLGCDLRVFALFFGFIGLLITMQKGGAGLLSAIDNVFQISILYGMILLGLSGLSADNSLLREFQFIGKLSYSFYLWHIVVIYIYRELFFYIDGSLLPSVIKFMLSFLLVTLITLIVSKISYKYIELPGIRMGEYIKMKLIGNK